jgi:hypothetical protein
MESKYATLKGISVVIKVMGWVLVGAGIFALVAGFVLLLTGLASGRGSIYTVYAFGISLFGGMWGILMVGVGGLIPLFIDIEQNTRRS